MFAFEHTHAHTNTTMSLTVVTIWQEVSSSPLSLVSLNKKKAIYLSNVSIRSRLCPPFLSCLLCQWAREQIAL